MHKVRIFLNDKASNGANPFWQTEVSRYLFRSDLKFFSPKSVEELRFQLRQVIQEKADVVISVGGDGTMNLLAQELALSETALLVIPAGTANDLAHELGLHSSVTRALQLVRGTEPTYIDLIKINQTYMASNGGIGLSTRVAADINSIRKQVPAFKNLMKFLNSEIYSLVLGFELLKSNFPYYDIEVESEEFQGRIRTPLLMINNQTSLGGKFKIAPQTQNSDGTFNVSIFLHRTKFDLIQAIAKIRYGKRNFQGVEFKQFECKHLILRSKVPLTFFGDGEILEQNQELRIEIIPRGLKTFRSNEESLL